MDDMTIPDVSESERQLLEAYRCGRWLDLGAGSDPAHSLGSAAESSRRIIRAEVLKAALLGAVAAEPGCAAAVQLRGAHISGPLDLTGINVSCAVAFEDCSFDHEIRFAESVTRSVRIIASQFPGFDGTRMRVDGIIDLSDCVISQVVMLDQAKITGQLSLRDMAVGSGSVAVSGNGLSVEGGVDCTKLVATGAVSMRGIQVTGSIDLTEARITSPGPAALMVGNAVIGGRLIGRGLQVDGELVLHDSRVTRIELAGAQLHNPAGTALSGGGLIVSGGLFCNLGFTAHGRVWLVGARIGANLALHKAELYNPGKMALILDRTTIGDCDGSDLRCQGQISLVFARIASGLSLTRAHLESGGEQSALVADGGMIEGTLRLDQMRVRGMVHMTTAHVGQRLVLTGARLENPAGIVLLLSGTEIAADMFCRDAEFLGGVRLTGARIRNHLDLDHVRLIYPGGHALDARGLQANELSLLPAEPIQGTVDLSNARIGILREDPTLWPERLNLDGLTYQVLNPPLTAGQRLRWLTRHPDGYAPQPYEQLAAYYIAIGQPAQARRIQYARERLHRRTGRPLARIWNLLQDVTVGYGYQPWRALLWLALLLAAGSALFTAAPPPPLQATAAPHFNAIIYTLDLLLPVVDLRQKNAFNPAGAEQWFSYFLTAAGWVLATTIAAGAARVLSRQ
jgi:hypothetical protein